MPTPRSDRRHLSVVPPVTTPLPALPSPTEAKQPSPYADKDPRVRSRAAHPTSRPDPRLLAFRNFVRKVVWANHKEGELPSSVRAV